MSKIFLGIDPGLSGALAFYDADEDNLIIIDMPTVEVTRNGKKKREVSAALVADAVAGKGVTHAFMERVSAMPGQGVSSMFSFGRSSGIVEGVLAAYEIPTTLITPQVWMKSMNVRSGKDGSRERAMQLFPAHSAYFARKKDDGRSDAALIAMFCVLSGHKVDLSG
jgi:crossover junction endodeoxyribonuclease RuvC